MDNYTIRDRIRGSLIGGAIGDALGYPVEFIYSFGEIQRRYGRNGITRLDTHQWWLEEDNGNGKAVVSDDTQMTLFTACGLLNAKAENDPFLPSICEAYIEWLFTQMGKKKKGYDKCWIRNVPELNVRRAPGHTCITSLNDIFRGDDPINNSKGCGGVMRIAPIPLYGATTDRMDIQDVCKLAADASELTHQHPLGYIPSALVAYVIYKLAQDEAPERETCKDYIREGLKVIAELFPNYPEEVKRFTTLIKTAILWSDISTDDVRTIEEELGGGWVAEETVAIAVYCSLAYFDNFERAMIASVNHKGDSDSTGAVTGNILGAAIGYDAIPQHFKDDVELHDVILHVADDLWRDKTTEFLNNK